MEATLLRMLSLLRRTHVYYINRTISFTCHPPPPPPPPHTHTHEAIVTPTGSQPRRQYLQRRQDLPNRESLPNWKSPDPTSRTPESTRHGSYWPWWPSPVTTRLPRKGGYPRTREGRVSPPSDLPETSASPTRVSAAVTGMFQIHSANRYMSTPDSSGLRWLPNRTPLWSDPSLPTGPTSPSDILNCAAPAHLRTILIYGLTFPQSLLRMEFVFSTREHFQHIKISL